MLKTPATAGTARENGNHHRRMIAVNNSTCSVSECSNKVVARGWCSKHYKRKKREGAFQPKEQAGGKCTIKGCDDKHRALGYCNKHWKRFKKHGDPHVGIYLYATPDESFAARTEWQGDCLVWTASKVRGGYGVITVGRRNVLAHRYAWEREYGPIPEVAQIDHKCWNPACCNVAHLRLSTPSENSSYRSGPAPGTSTGVRNVHHNHTGKYRVRIKVAGKEHYFGVYETIEKASEVAERERNRLFGDFAGRG